MPPARTRYLAEIADSVRGYKARAKAQARLAREVQQLRGSQAMLKQANPEKNGAVSALGDLAEQREAQLLPEAKKLLAQWPDMVKAYAGDEYVVKIRDKEIRTGLVQQSLSGTKIRKVVSAAVRMPRRAAEVADAGQRARQLPLQRRRVRLQARGRGPDAHVRGRGRRLPHQPPLQAGERGPAGQAPLHRVRFGHALRRRPRAAARHLRQGGQQRREHRDAGRHEGALQRLQPLRPGDQRQHDDQRPRADDPGDVHEHRHRPAAGQVQARTTAASPPTPKRPRSANGCWPMCAAPCRRTS